MFCAIIGSVEAFITVLWGLFCIESQPTYLLAINHSSSEKLGDCGKVKIIVLEEFLMRGLCVTSFVMMISHDDCYYYRMEILTPIQPF